VQPSFDSGVFVISCSNSALGVDIAFVFALATHSHRGEKKSLYEGSCPQRRSVALACHTVLMELELAVTVLFSLEHKPFRDGYFN